MAKSLEARPHDLSSPPAWFAAVRTPQPDEGQWDWLAAQDAQVEVTEFPVSDRFLAALFGISGAVA